MQRMVRALVLAAAVLPALRVGAEKLDTLAWRQPILGGIASGQVYRVLIPSEVFDGCRSFPADIRIFDDRKAEWPFFLWAPPRRDDLIPVFATLGRRTGGTNSPVVVQELIVGRDQRKGPPRHNQVSILTAGHNFIRRVEVLASDDAQNWKEVGSGFLVDQTKESLVSNRIIHYEETTMPHLLLRIHANASDTKEAIQILDAQIACRVISTEPLQEVRLTTLPLPPTEFRDGVMTVAFDTGAQNRPLERLRANVSGSGEYTLPLKVFGRSDASMPWRWVADGGLYRVGGQSRETVELGGAAFRQLKIEFYHFGQNQPSIDSIAAEALPQFLVFESLGGSSPMLHYGAEKTPLPRYDLQRRTREDSITNLPIAELGKAKSNPLKVASGLSDYLRTMAWVAAAIIGGAFLFIVLRSVRARL